MAEADRPKYLPIDELESRYVEAALLADTVKNLHRDVDSFLEWAPNDTPDAKAAKKRALGLKTKVRSLIQRLHDRASEVLYGIGW
jgi:hypothetical protein